MPVVSCGICNKEFYVKPSHLQRGWGKYCSINCRTKGQFRGQVILCFICHKEVYKPPLEFKRSKSGKHFCSKSCQTIWRNTILYSGENHFNWKHGESAYRRIVEVHGYEKICVLCKTQDERVLIVHHIDKYRKNNKINNLIRLCNNCHYLVHHYPEEQEKLKTIIEK